MLAKAILRLDDNRYVSEVAIDRAGYNALYQAIEMNDTEFSRYVMSNGVPISPEECQLSKEFPLVSFLLFMIIDDIYVDPSNVLKMKLEISILMKKKNKIDFLCKIIELAIANQSGIYFGPP